MSRAFQPLRRVASAVGGQNARFREEVARGDGARDARNWEAAVTHYEAALAVNPADFGIGVQLGHALKETGRFAEAEIRYKAFRTAYPDDPDIHLQLGHLAMRRSRVEEARLWYENTLTLAPADGALAVDARKGLARCADAPLEVRRQAALALVDRARFADAYPELLVLVEEPGGDDLVATLGNVCKELGRFDEARAWYAHRRTLPDGGAPDVLFDVELQLGHLSKISRGYAEALGHYQFARRMLPQTRHPSATQEELEGEIRLCLSQLTSAVTLV